MHPDAVDFEAHRQLKVVYIAGPYRADTQWGMHTNIKRAERTALDVWFLGGVALCPHKNTAYFEGAWGIESQVWLDGDLELLSRCDAVYLAPDWEKSEGARAEIKFAKENNIPILYTYDDLQDFIGGVT